MYIFRVKGNQWFGKTLKDVKGFFSTSSGDFLTFPMNLETFFPNLEAIRINYGSLKEITQQNLMNFPYLKYLNLDSNDIEVLEIDLFAFNPLLKVIWFANNKLNSIADESLKNLVHLQKFYVKPCISSYPTTHNDVTLALTQIHQKCPYSNEESLKVLNQREKSLKTQTECLTKLTNNTKNDEIFQLHQNILIGKIKDLKTTQIRMKEIEQISAKLNENNELQKSLEIKTNSIKILNDEKQKVEKNFNDFKQKNQDLTKELNDAKALLDNLKHEKEVIMGKHHNDQLGLQQDFVAHQRSTKKMNNFLIFVAFPLVCLITLINIAVCVTKCVDNGKKENEAPNENIPIEMTGVSERVLMSESKNFD
jgi:hypothetical protein